MARRSKAAQPLHERWTQRFWLTRLRPQAQLTAWHAEFMKAQPDLIWTRLIIDNWLGSPLVDAEQVLEIAAWLADAGDPLVFVTPRGRSGVSAGAQVWCVRSDVSLLVHLMAAPVIQTRTYSPTEFDSQLELMLNWMRS